MEPGFLAMIQKPYHDPIYGVGESTPIAIPPTGLLLLLVASSQLQMKWQFFFSPSAFGTRRHKLTFYSITLQTRIGHSLTVILHGKIHWLHCLVIVQLPHWIMLICEYFCMIGKRKWKIYINIDLRHKAFKSFLFHFMYIF